ncbi:pyridoxamine 5'-phosphate oxidase family protein [Pseudomonas sp. SL4(2022)]|uniref:2Fe-2S iron-sulfur cluster-binding protein n=1 Tax=Pseudomonas sp. SL4(2022) TaxID=2994661 RepID=UPI00226F54D1|nr:pyridoxamine 5'-phosphate oxidase family protein [Pseudomonas sp. SL4(2022)]WAC45743.1 pyridoxamine 5'-phosphate oxidase family protein [Pseudomonas sp. SL4(2022)]
MTSPLPPDSSPWHAGEKQLQERAGVAERMDVFGRRVIRDHMPDQHRDFYRQLPFVLLGSVDAVGRPWASILEGPVGFAHSPEPRLLRLDSPLGAGDPAAQALQDGAAVGLLGIELHTRRRNRLNGQVAGRDAQGLGIAVDQAFGNCPQYIQLRQHQLSARQKLPAVVVEQLDHLDESAQQMIADADTFFVASYVTLTDGRLAVDVSHRGGQAGFVRVQGNRLSIPDFAGNLHFNTLGNLLLNPQAGLLFIDFATGDLLQLSGRTELTLEGEEIRAFQGAERLWHVEVEQVVRRRGALALRWDFQSYSPNSLMTGSWAQAAARLQAQAQRDQWRPLRVARVVEESASIRSFYLQPADAGGWPAFSAGQHLPLRLTIPGQAHPVVRTYSLSSAPSDDFLRISVKRDGLASAYLHEQIKVGSLLEAKAAQGQFVLAPEQRRPLVLLAAGVGITPLLSMLREVAYQNRRLRRRRTVWLMQSARQQAELAFSRELQELEQESGETLHWLRVLSQPETGLQEGLDFDLHGRIDVTLLKTVLPFDDYDFVLCGPSAFTQDLYDGLRELNISDSRLHAETFGPSSLKRHPDKAGPTQDWPPAASIPVPVLFEHSAKEARWLPGSGSLLELAESRGLTPEFSCRGGTCGICSTRIVSGQVTYPQPPANLPVEGEALICCAVPAAGKDGTQPLVLDL